MTHSRAFAINTSVESWAGGLIGTASAPDTLEIVRPSADLDVAVVTVTNDPAKRDEAATARHVIVNLSFFKLNSADPCLILSGRWSDNEQAGLRGQFAPIDDLRRRDLHPNGEPNLIDVALKYPDDEQCYAFNDETCRNTPDWRDPAFELAAQSYRVRVRLQGVGLDDVEHDFLLTNLGKGKGLTIRRLESTSH